MNTSEWIVEAAVLPHVVQARTCLRAVDGRLVAVDHDVAGPNVARLHGTLLPGFVDLQVNGAGGRSVDEATPDALDVIAAAVGRGGAVAFLPTMITAPWDRLLQQVAAVARWIEQWNGKGAQPLGLHVEGPFLQTPGAHDAACFVDPTAKRITELLAAAHGKLRLVTLAPSRAGAAAAIAQLTAAGVATALGHDDRGGASFAECVAAGARAVTHLFNVMGPLHHRDPGLAGHALDDERVVCPLVLDGAHVHPAMVRNAFRILGPERTMLVTDAVAAAGMPDGDYTLSGMPVRKQSGVVRDAKGTLAGSALTMAVAARNFLEFVPWAGAWTLARAAATNPARLVHADDLGELTIGKRAVFTLLGDDGTFTAVGLR